MLRLMIFAGFWTSFAMARKATRVPEQTKCQRCPLRQLQVFRAFEGDELKFIEWFKTGELVASPGATILAEGHNSPHLFTVLSGWAFRYKTLPDGRRQILNFAMAGDFLGLQSAMLEEMQHSIEALTDIVLCIFPRERLWSLYEKYPNLAFDVTWLASRSERLLDEQMLNIGRRSAAERMAYLLLYLFDRAWELGLAEGARVKLPVT